MKKFSFAGLFVFLGMALVLLQPAAAFAATEDGSAMSAEEITEDQSAAEGIKLPTRLGEFLRSFRERIATAFTFNAVKKADKQILYAEERINIAEQILENSDSEQAQVMAQKMVNRSQTLIERAQKKKERWNTKVEAKQKRIAERIERQEQRRQEVMNKIKNRLEQRKQRRNSEQEEEEE